MRRARRCTTWRVLRATLADEFDVPEAGQVLDRANSASQASPAQVTE